MTFSAGIYELAALIAALAFLLLVIFLIPALMQLKRTIRSVEELTVEGRKTVESVNLLAGKVREQSDDIEGLVDRFKEVGNSAAGLAEVIIENIRTPIITIFALIFGAEFGLKQFLSRQCKGEEESTEETKGGSTDERP